MNRIIAVVMVLLLGGCASYSEKTYYTPTNDLSWIVGELGTLIRTHKWDSGSELTIYLRTIDGNADLLFLLTVPEGATIAAPDLGLKLQINDGQERDLATNFIRRDDYVSSANNDYQIVYTNLTTLDGLSGATLNRPKAWVFKKLNTQFEWGIVANSSGAGKIILRFPTIAINGSRFSPLPLDLKLISGKVWSRPRAW